MSFLNPFFLFGTLALAVPILIHLVRRDKSQRVQFSSLMFLLRIPRKTIRQHRLRNLLLMAMRLLLLALLVAAFARPYLEESIASVLPDSRSRGIVMLLDTSYSMTYGTNFDRMKSDADDRIDGMEPGDRMSIIAFNEKATVLTMPTDDPNDLKPIVSDLEATSNATSYYEAFTLADRALRQLEGYDKELIVISDFQRNGWNRSSRESVIDADVSTELIDLGIDNPDNVGIDSVAVDHTVFTRTYTGQVMARLNNHNLADPATVPVAIAIDGREVERRTVTIPAESSELVEFTGFELPLGYSKGRVWIDQDDELNADNEFLFVLHRRDKLGVLLIDGGRSRQSYFLEQALTSAPDLPFAVDTVRAANLSPQRLDDYEVVVVNDAPRLDDDLKAALDERRANGQGQLFFLGEFADPNWWNTFEDLPVRLGVKVYVERDRDRPFYSLTSYERSHEVFEPLERSTRLSLNTARFFAYSDFELKPNAEAIAKFEDGSVAIAESGGAGGAILVFASSVDNGWNDFPLKPSFLPVVHEVVRYLAGYREGSSWYQLGEAIPVVVELDASVVLITPDEERLSMGEGASASRRFFTPELRGYYEVRVGADISHVAVNAPSSEGVMERIAPDELMASLQRLEGEERRGALLAESEQDDYARSQSWWWYLFLFALLVGIGEIYVGNRVTGSMSDEPPPVAIRG